MSYELTYKKEKDILLVKVCGMRSFKAIIEIVKDIQQICIKQKTCKVLIDVREMEGHLKTMEAYELPALVFPKFRDLNIFEKSAIVDREESRPYYSFFENVSVNRGFNLRVFTNIEDATEWLQK